MKLPQALIVCAVPVAMGVAAAVPAMSPEGWRRRRAFAVGAALLGVAIVVGYALGVLRAGATVRVDEAWAHAAPGLAVAAAGVLLAESRRRRPLAVAIVAIGLAQAASVAAARATQRGPLGYAAIVAAAYVVCGALLLVAVGVLGRSAERRGFAVVAGGREV